MHNSHPEYPNTTITDEMKAKNIHNAHKDDNKQQQNAWKLKNVNTKRTAMYGYRTTTVYPSYPW